MSNQLYYNYTTEYPLNLCMEYMQHDNIFDWFIYTWEEKEGRFFITFREYKNSMHSLFNAPKPTFEVTFTDLENSTGIEVQFVQKNFWPWPFVSTKDIDMFWQKN